MRTLILAAAALALAGCASETDYPASAVPEPRPVFQPAPDDFGQPDEDLYLDTARAIGPVYLMVTEDDALLEMGYTFCGSIESVGAELTMLNIYDASGGDEDALMGAAAVGSAAVYTLCPEHKAELDAATSKWGG